MQINSESHGMVGINSRTLMFVHLIPSLEEIILANNKINAVLKTLDLLRNNLDFLVQG